MNKSGVWAIVVAAGSGRRLGGAQPKAFVTVGRHPLLYYSLAVFARTPFLSGLVAVVPKTYVSRAQRFIDRCGWHGAITVCSGGRTRALSVQRALTHVPATAKIVVVHDAARPLVERALIEQVVKAAQRWGVAAAVRPVAATLKRCDHQGRWIAKTVDRSHLYEAQTPQAFRFDLWRSVRAHHTAEVTDEAAAFERAGMRVRAVVHTSYNIKVTWPDDLNVVRHLLASQKRQHE